MKKLTISLMILAIAFAGMAIAKDEAPKPLQPIAGDSRGAEVEPNDDCATANALTEAMDGEIIAADIDMYEFTGMAGDAITFETGVQGENPNMDTKMWLLADDCETELAYNDDGGESLFSLIDYTFEADATIYVKVTGYSETTTGFYTLVAEGAPEPQPNDTCEGAINLADLDPTFDVDLCLYANDYNPGSDGCTGYNANGDDAVYYVELEEGEGFSASMDGSHDLAIYLVTDCSDLSTCVAGDDSGNPEEITYQAETAGIYFLIVDGYSGCGVVTVTTSEVVSTQNKSLSGIKALYR